MQKLESLSLEASDDIILHQIVRDLRTQDLATQIEAIRAVHSMLCEKNRPIASMLEAGIIATLIDALDRDEYPNLEYRAPGVLTNAGLGARENTVLNDLTDRVIFILGCFALHGAEARRAVLAHGAVAAMLPYMRTDTPIRRLRTCVRTYSNLCSHDDDDKINLELVLPALAYIHDILDIENEESLDPDDKEIPFIARDILVDACTALTNIMHGPDEGIEAVQAVPGLTERLVALLGHEARGVREAALSAVGNMLAGSDAQVDRCLEANCLEHVASLLQSSNTSLVKEAARAAGNILAGTHSQIQRALEQDILMPLPNILAYGDPECQLQAVYAVTHFCLNGSAGQHEQLVSRGALPPYCAQLAAPDLAGAKEVLDGLDVLVQAAERDGDIKLLCYILDELDVLDHMLQLKEHITDEDRRCKIENMSSTVRKHAREERFIVHDKNVFTLEKIVEDLDSQDLATQTRATRALRCMLLEKHPPINALLEAGLMTPLVKCLDKNVRSDLHNLAAWALSNITAGTHKHKMAAVDSGAIPKLIALLVQEGKVANLAAGALGNLALHGPETRDALLVYVQSETGLTELRAYVRTYGNLCSQASQSLEYLEPVLRALSFVSALLDTGDNEILEEACWAYDNLMAGLDDLGIDAVQAVPGLTARLVALLGHAASRVQKAALTVVANMFIGNDTQVDRCLDVGCLDHVISLLQSSDSALVLLAAMTTFNILGGTPSQIQQALDKDILTPLLNILVDGEANCQVQAIDAITNISVSESAAQRARFTSESVLKPFCELLAAPDRPVVECVLESLAHLILNGENDDEVKLLCLKLDKIGVIEQLQQLQEEDIDMDPNHTAVKVSTSIRQLARKEAVVFEDGKLFTVQNIAQDLKSQDPKTQARAARAALILLCKQDAPISAIVEAGVVAPLVAVLDRDDCIAECKVLLSISTGTHRHRVAIVNAGAIPKLVVLLAQGGDSAILAIQILANLTLRAPVTRDMVLVHGAVRAILPYLRADTPPEMLNSCVVAFQMFCTDIVSTSMVDLASPALPRLTELLDIENIDVVKAACNALTNLMLGPDERNNVVEAVPGLMARLVALMEHEAREVRGSALDTISNMLSGTETHVDRCLEAGCLEKIVLLLQSDEPLLIERAVRALSNIFGNTHSHIQRVMDFQDKNILYSLVDMLPDSEPNSFLQFYIVSAINNITICGTREQRMAVVNVGAIPELVAVLAYEEAVAEPAANALCNISKDGAEATDMVLAHGAVQAMLPHLRPDAPPELLHTCVSAFGVWCRTIVSTSMFELVSPALPHLSMLLDIKMKNQKVLMTACIALGNLILGSAKRKETVQAVPGLVARLVALLGHAAGGGNVRSAALNVVANLLSGNETQTNSCLEAGCLDYLGPLLQSHDPALVEEAARAVCNMLRPNCQIQRALDKGILFPLLDVLADTKYNSTVKYHVVGALFNIITCGTREHKMAVVNSGAIPKLVAIISTDQDIEITKIAVDILGAVAEDEPEVRDLVLSHGAVRAMLPHMRADAPLELLRNCVQAYWSYCRCHDERVAKLELVSPALPHITELLGIGDEQVLEHACWALVHLTRSHEGVEAVRAEPGLVARLGALQAHAAADVEGVAITLIFKNLLAFVLNNTE